MPYKDKKEANACGRRSYRKHKAVLPERDCPICEKVFAPKQRNTFYCSKECSVTGRSGKYNREHPDRVKLANARKENLPSTRYYRMVYKARGSGLECTLSFEEWTQLVSKPCHWCGGELQENSYGTDRLYSDIGYVKDNCVPCCSVCNFAKRTQTPDEFRAWIMRVHAHQIKTPTTNPS